MIFLNLQIIKNNKMIMLSNETINKFLNKSNTFNDYQEQYDSLENCVISFVNILKNKLIKKI